MRCVYLLVFLPLMLSCSTGPRARVLTPDRFVTIYVDLLESSITKSNVPVDSAAMADSAQAILARDGTSRAEFDSTVAWYNADVRRWRPFYEDVSREIERRIKSGGM